MVSLPLHIKLFRYKCYTNKMAFPKNNSQLKTLFKNAQTPQANEFNGEYSVDMLTVLPSLKKFSHRKIFYPENNIITGHNILFKNTVWGHFVVEEGIYEDNGVFKIIVINYGLKKNSFISSCIRDQVRRIEKDNLYLGRFNYLLKGKLHFLGYFSLTKIPSSAQPCAR